MESLWHLALTLAQGAWRKTSAWERSSRLRAYRTPLVIRRRTLREVRMVTAALPAPESHIGNEAARELIERVRKETEVWNLNNVTRTQAYWNLYSGHRELHWALLAHLVSRNGGWSMTDLRGQWLPRLLRPETAEYHFELLETCNSLIFRDAYPQLKLYTESRRSGIPLFGLLPQFGVSAFMQPIWERFWRAQDPVLLTVALIVNEQHVIQKPVVENPYFRDRVFDTLSFRSLPLLQANQIVFPLLGSEEQPGAGLLRLAGRVLEKFENPEERIAFGKCLYGMLFGYPRVLTGAERFAAKVPHTGSRSDYWPSRFCAAKPKTGGKSHQGDFSAGHCWYSPTLETAWPDRPLPGIVQEDWFTDRSALRYVTSPRPPMIFDMTCEHLLNQRKWQTAAEIADS
jgi:hypothetical protein